MMYEIYLLEKNVSSDKWRNLIDGVLKYNILLKKCKLIVLKENQIIRYYIRTKYRLPITIEGLSSFTLKKVEYFNLCRIKSSGIFPVLDKNILKIDNYIYVKDKGELSALEIDFISIGNKILSNSYIYTFKDGLYKKYLTIKNDIYKTLSVDFSTNKRYGYKGVPKYLDIQKSFPILTKRNKNSILSIDTFPYLETDNYLCLDNYDFFKHSIVLGASGSGKSKFISSFIESVSNYSLKEEYRIIVIDPHAALERDIGGLDNTKVIDFKNINDSISLFSNNKDDVINSSELLLDTFKSLIGDRYNSKLERVLRHSISILLYKENFNFTNLRKLLLELEYRTNLVKEMEEVIPSSITSFFLTDFNDLKTKSYGEAISPIISFIDEMEMIPVFNLECDLANLEDVVKNNFLTLFSLDSAKLGLNISKTIALLIMQQLFTLIQKKMPYKLIFIIDEVAVVESPIISRFLSEARKYNLALILLGQYFNQISVGVKNSIFANVTNYYIFKVSKMDASVLVENFDIKVPLDDTIATKMKLLTELNKRECIVRISANDKLLPAFKGRTLEFSSKPRLNYNNNDTIINRNISKKKKFLFKIGSGIKMKDILIDNSTSRRLLRDE